MITTQILWIAAIIVFSIIEATTAGLVSIWFAGGALASLIASLLGAGVTSQIFVFIIVSLILILILRRVAVKHFKIGNIKTNFDRIIGSDIIITQTVDNKVNQGAALVNDIEWKVKSENGEILNAGETATVVKIEGVRLIVKKS